MSSGHLGLRDLWFSCRERQIAYTREVIDRRLFDRVNRSTYVERTPLNQHRPVDPTCRSVAGQLFAPRFMSLREADSAGFFVRTGLWDDRLDFPSSPRSAVCVEFIYLDTARPRITFRVINCTFPYNFSITHVRNYLFRVSAALPSRPFTCAQAVEGSSWFITRSSQASRKNVFTAKKIGQTICILQLNRSRNSLWNIINFRDTIQFLKYHR